MAYVQGTHRLQTAVFCLEDFIASDAPVRVVDAFCNQIGENAVVDPLISPERDPLFSFQIDPPVSLEVDPPELVQ
jgi:hypothetical protein